MRELINIIDTVLTEASLEAIHMRPIKLSKVEDPKTKKIMTRQELFLYKVINSSPFTHKDTGKEVIIDPSEANNVSNWLKQGMPKPIEMKTIDGDTIKNNQLLKTLEFGSKEKEKIKLKGSDVFNVTDVDVQDLGNSIENIMSAGGFYAMDMYDSIKKSPQIKSLGKVGQAILSMAKEITEGKVPTIPKGLSEPEIAAIRDYAGEYLGVLGLVANTVPFINGSREDFDEFMQADLGSMIIYFPKSQSNPLADSFSITNDKTGHSIKISSKGAGHGAPPSLTSLKLSEEVRKKYPEAAAFLDKAQDPNLTAYSQPFKIINELHRLDTSKDKSLFGEKYKGLLPFSDELIQQLESTVATNKKMPKKVMDVFYKRLSPRVQNSNTTDGGKAWYAVTTDVMRTVNEGSVVPHLREALIESLGYNFIQLYTDIKGDKLVTKAFWPAKLKGVVKLKTKGSAADPKKGKISVEISPGKEKTDIPVGTSTYDKPVKKPKKLSKAAKELTRESYVGRKKRK